MSIRDEIENLIYEMYEEMKVKQLYTFDKYIQYNQILELCKNDTYKLYVYNRFKEYRCQLSALLVLETHNIKINDNDEIETLCNKVDVLYRMKKLKKIENTIKQINYEYLQD